MKGLSPEEEISVSISAQLAYIITCLTWLSFVVYYVYVGWSGPSSYFWVGLALTIFIASTLFPLIKWILIIIIGLIAYPIVKVFSR